MTITHSRLLLTAAVTVLAACMSTPAPRYFTIDMRPSGEANAPCGVRVERLRAVEPVARREIMIKASPTEVEYYASDLWVADLGELVQEKLNAELSQDKNSAPAVLVSGSVLAFEQVDAPDGAEAHIKLELVFRQAGARRSDSALEKTYEVCVETDNNIPEAVVEALSRGLEEIAREIARDAGAFQAGLQAEPEPNA